MPDENGCFCDFRLFFTGIYAISFDIGLFGGGIFLSLQMIIQI